MAIISQNDQNQNNQNQDQTSVSLSGSGGVSTPSTNSSGRTASFSSGQQPGQKGSGRYTNLQKYLGANQGATDRLYQGIGGNINKETERNTKEANTQSSNVRAGIESANQGLQRGQGYLNQLNDQNFNAQEFAGNQNQLQDFSKFRTNQAIDQSGLQNQYNTALQAQQNTVNSLQNRANQVGSEQGRFNLLKETFGGGNLYKPTYSTGQQRLDQLFLQAGGGNKVGELQNQVKQNLNSTNQSLAQLQGDVNSQIGNIGTQAQQLGTNLQNKATGLETGYISDLENQVGTVNQQRDAQRAAYEKYVNQLAGKVQGEQLDPNLTKDFGLMQNQQLFNVPKNLNSYRDVVDVSDQQANNYRNIATEKNVNYYDALAKLAGINNDKLNAANSINALDSLYDKNTGGLKAAASAKQGDEGLQSRINKAGQDLLANAANTTASGYGVAGTGRGLSERTVNTNLLDFINRGNTDADSSSRDIVTNNPLYTYGGYSSTGRSSNRGDTDTAKDNAVNAARQSALAKLAEQGYFNTLGDTGGVQGSQNLADYREGGIYKPTKLI